VKYIFRKDWRRLYPDNTYRDYLAGTIILADELNSAIIKRLLDSKIILPVMDRSKPNEFK
jgi:hypothetical protein